MKDRLHIQKIQNGVSHKDTTVAGAKVKLPKPKYVTAAQFDFKSQSKVKLERTVNRQKVRSQA